MSNLMSLAAIKASASLPVNGFNSAYILFQIITYECSGVAEQIFMLTPHTAADINHRQFILVGAAIRNAKIQALHPSQIERGLCLIGERLKRGTLNDSGLRLNDIVEAVANYKSIGVDIVPDGNIALTLSNKISILMNKSKPDPEYLDVLVYFGDIKANPKTIEFVGYTSGDDLLRVRINSDEIDKNSNGIHLLDDFKLEVNNGTGFDLEYNGEILEFAAVDDDYVFEINRHYMFDMKNTLMDFMGIKGINENPKNMFYYISRSLGVKPENIKIEDYDNRIHQTYIVVIPIDFLKVEDRAEIGKVEFYDPQQNIEETELIKSLIHSNDEIWESAARGKINVQADNPYDAYIDGREQIELALNILMHLARSDTIHQGYSASNKAVDWHRRELQPKPKLSTWSYINNAANGEHLVHNTKNVAEIHMYSLNNRMKSMIKDLEWYESLQRRLNSNDCTKREREIIKATYDSLNWLRRSWDAETPEEQIIYANMAMEFIVNTESCNPMIPMDLNDYVVSGALLAFQENFDGTAQETEKYLNDLKGKLIWSLGNVPIMVKVDYLISRLDIPIREQDLVLLRKMRKRRNDIIHGRPMQDFSKVELWKLNQVISTLAAYKLRSLIGNTKGDSEGA